MIDNVKKEKVIVIGGGPAGLSAAIYLARSGLSPLVFAGSPSGGQLTLTSEVENFPSQESILGAELIEKMRRQAEKFGAKIIDQNITKVDLNGSEKKVYLSESLKIASQPETSLSQLKRSDIQPSENYFSSLSVIIATGAKALWLNVSGEEKLRGKGVSACATCDGFFFRDKTVAVVGGGDTAMEEALTLTKFAKKVYIIHRRDHFRASKIMQERVFNNPKIEIIWNTIVDEVLGEERVEGVRIRKLETTTSKPKNTDSLENLSIDGLFVAIGHRPDTEIFKGQVELDDHGYVITSQRLAMELSKQKSKIKSDNLGNEKDKLRWEGIIDKFDFNYQTGTSVVGVFAAGDCVDNYYRQAATAAGMGVAASLEVERYLEKIKI